MTAIKLVESKIFTHDDQGDHDPMVWIIYGKPGAGKTTAAQSISSYWPDKFPSPKPVMLRDVLHISWDPAGRIGTRAGGLRCAYALNALSLFAKHRRKGKSEKMETAADINNAILMISEETGNIAVKDTELRYAIDDTITFLNTYLLAYWGHPDNMPFSDRKDEEDTRGMFGKVLRWHTIYFAQRMMLPEEVTSLFLFHGKSLEDTSGIKDKKERQRQAMVRIAPDVSITLSITGSALEIYTAAASQEFALVPTAPPSNSKAEPERRLYTVPTQGYRAKNRMPKGVLNEIESLPLKNVMAKVATAAGWSL